MSLREKKFYFITDRSTNYRYLVDRSSGKEDRYIYYPVKYETMTDKKIRKYEKSLVQKFMWWGWWNSDKLLKRDWQTVKSQIVDTFTATFLMLLLARASRSLLFNHQFMALEVMMEARSMDVRFWKALFAYSTSFLIGYSFVKQIFTQTHMIDLAHEYMPNFMGLPPKGGNVSTAEKVFLELSLDRFDWLKQETSQE